MLVIMMQLIVRLLSELWFMKQCCFFMGVVVDNDYDYDSFW